MPEAHLVGIELLAGIELGLDLLRIAQALPATGRRLFAAGCPALPTAPRRCMITHLRLRRRLASTAMTGDSTGSAAGGAPFSLLFLLGAISLPMQVVGSQGGGKGSERSIGATIGETTEFSLKAHAGLEASDHRLPASSPAQHPSHPRLPSTSPSIAPAFDRQQQAGSDAAVGFVEDGTWASCGESAFGQHRG